MRYNYNSALYTLLEDNEKPLWQGKPNKTCFILEAIFNPLLPFAIIWALVDFGFIHAAFSNPGKYDQNVLLFTIPFFTLHLMPVWIYLGGILVSFFNYKHTEFLVSDKGIYCSYGVFSTKYKHKSLSDIKTVTIERGMVDNWIGVGDVNCLEDRDKYYSKREFYNTGIITICDIPDFSELYHLINQLINDTKKDNIVPDDMRPYGNIDV